MDRQLAFRIFGVALATGGFFYLWLLHDDIPDRGLSGLLAALAGICLGLAFYGFASIGRYTATRKK